VISIGSRFSFTCSISGKRFFRASLAVMDTSYSPDLVVPFIVPDCSSDVTRQHFATPSLLQFKDQEAQQPSVEWVVDSGPRDGREVGPWKKCEPLIIPRSWVRSPPALPGEIRILSAKIAHLALLKWSSNCRPNSPAGEYSLQLWIK
jgi:hypothetical protein